MNSGKVFLGVVAGLAAGAALGVLLAPDKESKTRKIISKKTDELVDAINDKVHAIPGSSSPFGDDPPDAIEASLHTFSYEFLSFDGSQPIPCMAAGANAVSVYGRFVFAAADGSGIYVLARAQGSGLLHDWGLAVLPVE